MKNLFILIGILLIVSSCALHHGSFNSQNSLGPNGGSVKGYAIGISSASYFLGIGGLKKNALFFEAKKNMLLSYPLEKGQFFANYTTDYSFRNLILFQKAKVIVTADIIQSNDTTTMYSKEYLESLSYKGSERPFFAMGDSVEVLNSNELIKGKIIAVKGKKLILLFPSVSQPFRTASFDQASCYKKSYPDIEARYGIKAGDIIKYEIKLEKDVIEKEAEVCLLNPVGMLVKANGKYKVIEYRQLKK